MEGGIGSVILGFIIWRISGNIWVGAIGAVILWPLFSAIFGSLGRSISMIGVKTPPFYLLREPAYEGTAGAGKGVRVLLMTTREIMEMPPEERMAVYEALYADGLSKFWDKEVFRRRMQTVRQEGLPVGISSSVCKMGHMPSMTKCFVTWRKILTREAFVIGEDDKDCFIEDLTIHTEGAAAGKRAAVAFFFDKNMEIPEDMGGAPGRMPECPALRGDLQEITV